MDEVLGRLLAARAAANLRRGRRRLRPVLPRQQQPDLIRGMYLLEIKHAVAPMRRAVESLVKPIMPGLLASAAAERARADAGESSRARAAVEAARGVFTESFRGMAGTVRSIAMQTSDFQKRQLGRQLQAAVGIEVPLRDPALGPKIEVFTEENVRLIRSIPSRYFDEVEKLVLDAVGTGKRWETLADEIDDRFDVGESRAALIARDQVGKFYGELAKARQQRLGVKSYTWRTVRDTRVREEHQEREGEVFEWSDPPDDGHPGEPINCRCYAEPDLEAVLDDLEAA